MHDEADVWLQLEGRILDSFQDIDDNQCDNQGGVIDQAHIFQYLTSHRLRFNEVVRQVVLWCDGRQVAEVGVGYGATLMFLREWHGYDVVAFELPENIPLYCCALTNAGIPVQEWDAYSDSSDLETFDFVICSEVLEHLFIDVTALIGKIRPLLKVGGRVLLTTPNVYSLWNLLEVLKGGNIQESHPAHPRYENGMVVDGRIHPREYCSAELNQAFTLPHWRLLRLWGWPPSPSWKQRWLTGCVNAVLRRPCEDVLFVVAERIS